MSVCFSSPNRNRTLEWHSGSAVLCHGCQTDICRGYLSILIKTEWVNCEIMHLQTVNLYFWSLHSDYFEFGCACTAGSSGGTADWLIRLWWIYLLRYSWTMPAQIKGTIWCLMLFYMLDAVPALINLSVEQKLHFCDAITVQLWGCFFFPAWTSVLIMFTVWFNGREAGWALGFDACLLKAQNQNKLNPEGIPCMQKPGGKKAELLQRKPDVLLRD